MQFDKVRYTAKASAAVGCGRLSRFIVLLFAATMPLAPPAIVLAQQPAQADGQHQGVAAITKTRTETATTQPGTVQPAGTDAIRPFRVKVPQEALDDLRRRIAATRWPDKETVTDASQGVQLATIRELSRYWATDYDWRKCEARLNALPQFITTIDGAGVSQTHLLQQTR